MKLKRKRFLSLALAMALVLCLMPVGSASAADMTGGEVLYLKPNSNWTQAGARFAAYFFNNSTGKNTWVSMTDSNGDGIYEVTAPSGNWANVIFCRMNPSTSANNWDNKWNQTSDLTYDGTNNLYTVADGAWDNGGGTWSFHHERYTVAGLPELCGTDWDPSDTNNDMTLDGNLYTKTFYNVPAGSYTFKIVADQSWAHAWPSQNKAFTVTHTVDNITITFDEATKAVSVVQSCAHAGDTEFEDSATCKDDGTKTEICVDCGAVLGTTDSPATGKHSYNANGVCSVCGDVCTHADHETDGSCKACGIVVEHSYVNGFCSVCGKERNIAAQIGQTEYATFAEALAAAREGDTVVMLKAAEISSLMLMDSICVDLNGCTLTAGYVAAYPGSTIIDSAGGGLLKVSKKRVMLQKDNGYLPIWNGTDGYMLRACTKLNSKIESQTETSLTYKFLPTLGADAYALLAEGADASGVKLKVEVSWDKGDGTIGSTIFTYTDALIKEFYDTYDSETGKFGSAFTLGLSGIAGKDLSYRVYFESDTGVLMECITAA